MDRPTPHETDEHMLTLLEQLKTPRVRDLAWTVGSAPSLHVPKNPLFMLDEEHRRYLADAHSMLMDLDSRPESLERWLASSTSTRLGLYFERLLYFWIKSNASLKLLAYNHQVSSQGRTLGAFDFIVGTGGGPEHWEVAIKYYLGVTGDHDWSTWIGPNQRDRLDIKMNRMRTHQLALSQTPEGRQALTALGVNAAPVARLWIKGYFFRPWGAPVHGPHSASSPVQHLWIDTSCVAFYLADCAEEIRWAIRQKPDWLSPIVQATQPMTRHELRGVLKVLEHPLMVSEFVKTDDEYARETRRVFLVPHDWRRRAHENLGTRR